MSMYSHSLKVYWTCIILVSISLFSCPCYCFRPSVGRHSSSHKPGQADSAKRVFNRGMRGSTENGMRSSLASSRFTPKRVNNAPFVPLSANRCVLQRLITTCYLLLVEIWIYVSCRKYGMMYACTFVCISRIKLMCEFLGIEGHHVPSIPLWNKSKDRCWVFCYLYSFLFNYYQESLLVEYMK